MELNTSYDRIFSEIKNEYQIFNIQNNKGQLLVSGRYKNEKLLLNIDDFKNYYFLPNDKLNYYIPFLPMNQVHKVEGYFNRYEILEKFKYVYEADLSKDNKFNIDINLKYPSNQYLTYRFWMFDIEAFRNFKNGSVKENNMEHFINMLTFYDNFTDKYYSIFVIDKNNHSYKPSIKETKADDGRGCTIFFVNDERELFTVLLKLLKKFMPDIISGWNIIKFDIDVILKFIQFRYPDLFIEYSYFDGVEPYKFLHRANNIEEFYIPGLVSLDYLFLYKKFSEVKRESYSLDYITKIELKDDGGKVDYDGTLDELYVENPDLFIKYNIKDVSLLLRLEEKLMFLSLANQLKEISSCSLNSFNYNNSTKFADSLICGYIRTLDTPMVMKSCSPVEVEKFSGGNVRFPIVGFHNYLIDLDAKSMYPSIIRTWRISPENLLLRVKEEYVNIVKFIRPFLSGITEEIDAKFENIQVYFPDNTIRLVNIYKVKEIIYKISGGLGNFSIAPNGSVFMTKNEGIIPSIQKNLVDQRSVYKDRMKLWGYVVSYLDKKLNKDNGE